MLYVALTIIGENMVTERHYFLEALQTPLVLWVIRGCCVFAAMVAFTVYLKMKHRNGD